MSLHLPTLEETIRYARRGRSLPLPPMGGGSDWRLSDEAVCEGWGTIPGGTTVTASATANTKGAWVQLTASSSRPTAGLWIAWGTPSATSVNYLLDIAVGASGSEQIVVPNVPITANTTGKQAGPGGFFPVSIPAGSRVSVRIQASSASATIPAWITAQSAGLAGQSPYSRITDYGAVTASSRGTSWTGGAPTSMSAWTQLSASTTNPMRGLVAYIGNGNSSVQGVANVGVGASGSEQVIVPGIATGPSVNGGAFFFFPVSVPSGSRLSMQAASNSTAVYGMAWGLE